MHRLDKDTSGIILVAKNDTAHAKLGEAFRQRTVKKTYIALVEGLLKEDSGRIEFAIGRDPKRRVRMTARRTAVLADAREARTDWRVLARIDTTTLGRSPAAHRAHASDPRALLSAASSGGWGHALRCGAAMHAGKTALPPLGRNFLHAAKLGFAHPRTGAWIELRAPLPHAFCALSCSELAAAAGRRCRTELTLRSPTTYNQSTCDSMDIRL